MDSKALRITAVTDSENNMLIKEFELNLSEDDIDDLYHKIFLARMGPPGKGTGKYKLKIDFQ